MPARLAPNDSGATNVRWFVCFLLFLATTINYMDRSVLSLIEPLLHLPFMGWVPGLDAAHQFAYNNAYGDTVIAFQIAYGIGLLTAGRIIDRLGTKNGYALAICIWAAASCCSGWENRATFPPRSRPQPSGFPQKTARSPQDSSTPAPMPASLLRRS